VRRLSAAFLVCALAATASAEWTEIGSSDEHSADARVIYRHVDLHDSLTGKSEIIDLAIFLTKSCRLRVIDNADGVNDLRTAMASANCIAGVNGGYFDPNFAPLGLRIIDGKITSRLSRGRLMSGVLASDGSVQILRLAEFSLLKKWNAAIEGGPFLVDHGQPVRGLEKMRSARRTFAAIASANRAALGYCPDATLADLATILATPRGDFKIQRALNLDGGSSSAFWFRRDDASAFSIPEEKSVRDFVGIVAK
jgi:hypothetical protein